jgi:eukaryotic-like serine/threonine-protein kinase
MVPTGPPDTARGLRKGDILQGTYEVVRLAGKGGMGEVYETRHLRIPGRFAVKVLHGSEAPSRADLARFRREAEITSSLRHPNIVQVLDFNQLPDGAPYLVMEFLEGVDLAQRLAGGARLSPFDVVKFVAQLSSALAAAHAHGVVHRDLKPQNVFVVPMAGQAREFVKILDFGISTVKRGGGAAGRITGGGARISSGGQGDDPLNVVGTPQYMSPEQALGERDVDAKTDQFALAAIAYEMLCGRPAFPGATLPAVLFGIMHGEPAPLPAVVLATLGVQGDAALRRALAKNRNDRYGDVLEFAQALQEAVLWGSGLRTPRPVDPHNEFANAPDTIAEPSLSPSVELAAGELAIAAAAESGMRPLPVAAPPSSDHLLDPNTLSAIPTMSFRAATPAVSRRRHRVSIALLTLVAAGGWLTALISPRAVEDRVEPLATPIIENAKRIEVAARPSGQVFVEITRPVPGLRVFIDGHPVSLPIALVRGTAAYHLRAEAPGHQPYETWIDAVTDRAIELPLLRQRQ